MALDFRDQYFGCEIEMTGLTRQQAARTLAELFGTSITHYGGTYDGYRVTDREGKDWKIVSDGSIHAFRRSNGRQVPAGREYRVEMNSPKLEYAEMEKLQEVVRALPKWRRPAVSRVIAVKKTPRPQSFFFLFLSPATQYWLKDRAECTPKRS